VVSAAVALSRGGDVDGPSRPFLAESAPAAEATLPPPPTVPPRLLLDAKNGETPAQKSAWRQRVSQREKENRQGAKDAKTIRIDATPIAPSFPWRFLGALGVLAVSSHRSRPRPSAHCPYTTEDSSRRRGEHRGNAEEIPEGRGFGPSSPLLRVLSAYSASPR